MKRNVFKLSIVAATIITSMTFTGCVSYQTTQGNDAQYYQTYNNPKWGPTYYPGARYYYLPDIESYYDLSTGDFILLNMGRWIYVKSIAPYYTSYDLFNGYIVVLNVNVYQPWMHHQYYIRNYPRYYYIDYYDYCNIPYVRGFNENKKAAIYWNQQEQYRARPWDDRNMRQNRRFTYSAEDRKVQQETTRRVNQERAASSSGTRNSINSSSTDRNNRVNDNAQRNSTNQRENSGQTNRNTQPNRTETSRTTNSRDNIQSSTPNRAETQTRERGTNTNYYGNPIGSPVKVEPQMRRTDSETSRGQRESNSRNDAKRDTNTQRQNTRTQDGR